MKIRTFKRADLRGAMDALRSAFEHEHSDALFNEWTFAENLLHSDGYLPELCVIAVEEGQVVGYNALTRATIGGCPGLALGPLGVRKAYQRRGIGAALVQACVERARAAGFPWIALLGGDYYTRFGFESGKPYGIAVSENVFDNDHLQMLFLDDAARGKVSGKLVYCDAFYDAEGNLL